MQGQRNLSNLLDDDIVTVDALLLAGTRPSADSTMLINHVLFLTRITRDFDIYLTFFLSWLNPQESKILSMGQHLSPLTH